MVRKLSKSKRGGELAPRLSAREKRGGRARDCGRDERGAGHIPSPGRAHGEAASTNTRRAPRLSGREKRRGSARGCGRGEAKRWPLHSRQNGAGARGEGARDVDLVSTRASLLAARQRLARASACDLAWSESPGLLRACRPAILPACKHGEIQAAITRLIIIVQTGDAHACTCILEYSPVALYNWKKSS